MMNEQSNLEAGLNKVEDLEQKEELEFDELRIKRMLENPEYKVLLRDGWLPLGGQVFDPEGEFNPYRTGNDVVKRIMWEGFDAKVIDFCMPSSSGEIDENFRTVLYKPKQGPKYEKIEKRGFYRQDYIRLKEKFEL